MTARTGGSLLAGGRVLFGVGLLLAPRATGRGWVGDAVAAQGGVQALLRALGVRDVALGLIALHTLDNPAAGPRWQRVCAACDAVDALATLAAARELPRSGVAATAAIGGGAALAGLWLAAQPRDEH